MKAPLVGLAVLVVAGAILGPAVARLDGASTLPARVLDHAFGSSRRVEARFAEPSGLVAGDPVLRVDDEALVEVGRVAEVRSGAEEIVVVLLDAFETRRLGPDAAIVAQHPGSNLGWALATLAPSPLRARLVADLRAAWDRAAPTAWTEASPALEERGSALLAAAAVALPAAIERERPRWEPVLARLRRDAIDAELSPALDAELWPRVRAECGVVGAALADDVVRELGLSAVFRAAWARAKDAVGVGDATAFAAEVERLFVERALPAVRKRAPELVDAAGRAVRAAWEAPALREALDRAARRVLADAEGRDALDRILRAAFVEDPSVRAAWSALLADPRLRSAADRLARAVEPAFESAVRDALLRDDGAGLDLRLVRVLRNVLLWKDRRFVRFDRSAAPGPAPAFVRGVRGA